MGPMQGAIEYEQCEHIQTATFSKEMWDRLCHLHVTQRQATNVHYYFQELISKSGTNVPQCPITLDLFLISTTELLKLAINWTTFL